MTDFMLTTSKERGLRSGTVPTPLVVGLGAACELANREMEYDHQHVKRLSDMLVQVKVLVVMVLLFTMFGRMVVDEVELLPGTWVALRRVVGPALPRPYTFLVYTSPPA